MLPPHSSIRLPLPIRILGSGMLGPVPGAFRDRDISLPEKKRRRTDRVSRLAILGARAALADADWPADDTRRKATGLHLGNSTGAFIANVEHQRIVHAEGGGQSSPAAFSGTLPNVPTGWTSIAEGLAGSMWTHSGGILCAAEAIERAARDLGSGRRGPRLSGSVHGVDGASRDLLLGKEAATLPEPFEASAFLLLGTDDGEGSGLRLSGAGLSRRGEPGQALAALIGDLPSAMDIPALIAGSPGSDPTTREMSLRLGLRPALVLSGHFGDLGEAAPAVAAVLATRWLAGKWVPQTGSHLSPPTRVLVIGQDEAGQRGYALVFESRT